VEARHGEHQAARSCDTDRDRAGCRLCHKAGQQTAVKTAVTAILKVFAG
jgi:hypothetical protein